MLLMRCSSQVRQGTLPGKYSEKYYWFRQITLR